MDGERLGVSHRPTPLTSPGPGHEGFDERIAELGSRQGHVPCHLSGPLAQQGVFGDPEPVDVETRRGGATGDQRPDQLFLTLRQRHPRGDELFAHDASSHHLLPVVIRSIPAASAMLSSSVSNSRAGG